MAVDPTASRPDSDVLVRVALESPPHELPPEDAFRGAPRYIVEGVPSLTWLAAGDS